MIDLALEHVSKCVEVPFDYSVLLLWKFSALNVE